MKKKIGTLLLAITMMLTMISTSAFAITAGDLETGSNSLAQITVKNEECKELGKIGDLSVEISKGETKIEIPVQRTEVEGEQLNMWLGQGTERIRDEIMGELARIQEDANLMRTPADPMDTVVEIGGALQGWDVEILGLPEGHYTYDYEGVVITQEIVQEIVDMIKEMFVEDYGEFTTFKAYIEKSLEESGLTLDDLEAEERAELEELMNNIDPIIEYLTSSNFTGFLISGTELVCDCPYMAWYQIQHRYYKQVNGNLELVGVVNEGEYDPDAEEYFLSGEAGKQIRAKDFLKSEYKGATYGLYASYDWEVMYDEWNWNGYELDAYTLGGEEWYDGLILRYVMEEPAPGVMNKEKSPDTGDHSPMSAYVVLMVAAILAVGSVAAYKKK